MKLAFVGDTFLKARNGGNPFCRFFGDYDLGILNLETALTDFPLTAAKHYAIRTPLANAAFLKRAGFLAVNIENNHAWDAGYPGIWEMRRELWLQEILWENGNMKVRDCELAMFFAQIFHCDRKAQAELLEDVREKRHFNPHLPIIVNVHWGEEHSFFPSPEQREFARKLALAGASVIAGHHAHVIQPVETFAGCVIAYSLGNFNFFHGDVENTLSTRLGLQLNVHFKPGEAHAFAWEIWPILIDPEWRPRKGGNLTAAALADYNEVLSEALDYLDEEKWYKMIGPRHLQQTTASAIATVKKGYVWKGIKKYLRWLTREHTRKCLQYSLPGCSKEPAWPRQVELQIEKVSWELGEQVKRERGAER